ncbi:LysR family transcriptional regulator [Amycolatopsis sp. PS_44_ISF1]|uniref:LysR family transcriptional regulator n=1 Tax=Amycolatopsis sp. PS_44_ISF1 TaxID=2974917 RepID=UPI0028DF4CF2|nr:LysR family transcriptional regulator [Amycolatopsis sp. PS_44_ISF1]MDT8913060.1 LysR family transcriptional regulator [Amycolatopsis sp. PS_44_ISF1]
MATLRGLECLVAVLDSGSVTEAAARLHLSQPALSHQLAALEKEIGTPLLERLPRGTRATTAGRAVEQDARAALRAAERVVATGRAVGRGVGGRLRIACAESMTVAVLAPVLRRWQRRHPAVELALTELTSADALADAVTTGEADLAVGPRPARWTGPAELVGLEEVVVAMARAHPLAGTAGGLGFTGIAAQPVVHYHELNGLGGWLDEVAAAHGVRLHAVTRTRQATTAAHLAAAGLGLALVPTTALNATFPGAVRSLKPLLRREIVTLTGAGADPLVRRFESDLLGHGVPVPKTIADQLAGPPA